MTPQAKILRALNETGGTLYTAGTGQTLTFCWCGERAGRIWFHLGDAPHWQRFGRPN